jgi:hypothetical protein
MIKVYLFLLILGFIPFVGCDRQLQERKGHIYSVSSGDNQCCHNDSRCNNYGCLSRVNVLPSMNKDRTHLVLIYSSLSNGLTYTSIDMTSYYGYDYKRGYPYNDYRGTLNNESLTIHINDDCWMKVVIGNCTQYLSLYDNIMCHEDNKGYSKMTDDIIIMEEILGGSLLRVIAIFFLTILIVTIFWSCCRISSPPTSKMVSLITGYPGESQL